MLTYLTVILGMDPHLEQPNPVYCRVSLMANKFTFPFGTAKKILLKDVSFDLPRFLKKTPTKTFFPGEKRRKMSFIHLKIHEKLDFLN